MHSFTLNYHTCKTSIEKLYNTEYKGRSVPLSFESVSYYLFNMPLQGSIEEKHENDEDNLTSGSLTWQEIAEQEHEYRV